MCKYVENVAGVRVDYGQSVDAVHDQDANRVIQRRVRPDRHQGPHQLLKHFCNYTKHKNNDVHVLGLLEYNDRIYVTRLQGTPTSEIPKIVASTSWRNFFC